ncbi:MAG TPA: hypothetical protein DD670_13495 [Planctomycetaceae bacterium]|nr:hypothetical protein [Planctomycetaceae bacterium]
MTQRDLNRAVARATGESPCVISRFGFGIADPAIVAFDPEPYDQRDTQDKHLDWEVLADSPLALVS